MKVLIIRNFPSLMDVERNTYNIQEIGLAKALVRRGHTCDVLLWTNREEKNIELPVDECGKVAVFYRKGKTALKNTVYTKCDEMFAEYDVLQPAEYNQMQAWLLAKKYPYKTVIYHGPYFSAFNKRYNLMCSLFDCLFLKKYIQNNTQFIVKSNLAKNFLNHKGIKAENICVAGVGIDIQMLSQNGAECNEPLYKKIKEDICDLKILYIGRFEERRNIPFILKTFAAVLKTKKTAKLYMIGNGDKDYLDMVWRTARELGVYESIIYQQKIEQKYLSGIYKCADIFLLPTEYEIFGMVLLEAMYYKNIVITTDNGGSSTLIENGINGYVCDTDDAQRWAELILTLSLDKEKMEKVKENASSTVARKYTWDGLAEKFETVYMKD